MEESIISRSLGSLRHRSGCCSDCLVVGYMVESYPSFGHPVEDVLCWCIFVCSLRISPLWWKDICKGNLAVKLEEEVLLDANGDTSFISVDMVAEEEKMLEECMKEKEDDSKSV